MQKTLRLFPVLTLLLLACETGATGAAGPRGPAGPEGPNGPAGEDGAAAPDGRIAIHLPGPAFYPEGIAAASDGTFYVGSIGTGAIVRVPPNALGTEPFVEGRAAFGVYGLAVDEAHGTLWACTYDDTLPPAQPAMLKGYALATGALVAAHALPGESGMCNDVTVDGAGNVYATDSFAGTIVRLAAGGSVLETWSNDAAFPGEPFTFTLNGIAWDGAGGLYVVKTDTGALFHVPVLEDGSAGAPVAIAVEPALVTPDGLEVIDDQTLLVVQHATGEVVSVSLAGGAGAAAPIANGFEEPTTAVVRGGSAWVVEGQFRYFGAEEQPTLPFRVHRVALP